MSTTVLGLLMVLWWIFFDTESGERENPLGRAVKLLLRKALTRLWQAMQVAWQRWLLRIRPKALLQLVSELDLEMQGYRFSSFELGGWRGSLEVELHGRTGRSVTVRVENPAIPTALRLTGSTSQLPVELRTGDEDFDREVVVGGDDVTALALLDQETRGRVRELVVLGAEVGDSSVQITRSCLGQNAQELTREGARVLELAVELSHMLTVQGPELPGRLARNAENDPLSAVRRSNLFALGRHYPLYPESIRLHRACLAEDSAEPRLAAAEFLISLPGVEPETATEAARVLCTLAGTAELPEDLRVRSLEGLATKKDDRDQIRAVAEPVFEAVLAAEKGPMLVAAIGGVAALGFRDLLPQVVELAKGADSPVAVAVARALLLLGGPLAQPALLQMLDQFDPVVLQEAAKALGEVGDIKAVEPLLELSRSGGKEPVSQVALEAVRRIQGRLIGVEVGQLSLAASSELEGALSPYDLSAGPGDLSLAEAPPAPPRRIAEGS